MAITKKFKVSFDVTVKLGSVEEEQLKETIQRIAKQVAAREDVDHTYKELLVQALTGGPDGAVAFIIRKSIREGVKEMFEETDDKRLFKASPATVRVVKR